jgi:hypothetical protein
MVEEKQEGEIIDAEILEELTNPDWDFEDKKKPGPDKWKKGTRKKDFPKFTPKNKYNILNAAIAGLPPEVCAAQGDITPQTLQRWVDKGQRAQERIDAGAEAELAPIEVEFAEFFMALYKQSAQAMLGPYKTVHDAATTGGSVKAAQWILERRWAEYFSEKKQIQQQVEWQGRLTQTTEGIVDNRETAKRLSTEDLKALRASHIKLLEAGDEKKKDEE